MTNDRYALLRYAAVLYALGTLFHTLDHFRRGLDSISPEVNYSGTIATPIAVLAIFLAIAGFRYAPHIAVGFGIPHAIGITAVHLFPEWGAFSDSLPQGDVSPVSYAAVLAEIIGAALFAAAAAYVLFGEQRRRLRRAT